MTNAIETLKAKSRTQTTSILIEGLTMLESKYDQLQPHEFMVRACLFDVIEEREGEEFIDYILDCFDSGEKIKLN